jgi:hypothetical protein
MLWKNSKIREIHQVQSTPAGQSVRLIHGLWFAALAVLSISACSSSGEGAAGAGGSGAAAGSGNLCEAQFDALEKDCPVGAASKDANVQDCQQQERGLAGIGCQSAFDAWLSCTTKSGYDCKQDTGCEGPQNGYFSCQSQATLRTGCVRLAPQDATRCSDASKPYAFSCLGAAPASCVQVVTEGAGIWCCPQL